MPHLQCFITLCGITVVTKARHNILFWAPWNSTKSTVYNYQTKAIRDRQFFGLKCFFKQWNYLFSTRKITCKLTMGGRESPLHVYCMHVPPPSTTSELQNYVFYQEIKWISQISIMCWLSPDFEEGTNITVGTTDKIYCAQLQTRVGRYTWLWIRHIINMFMVLIFI